jgi:hypothetical protein
MVSSDSEHCLVVGVCVHPGEAGGFLVISTYINFSIKMLLHGVISVLVYNKKNENWIYQMMI